VGCATKSHEECLIADPVVDCWPLKGQTGSKVCNSSGVFDRKYDFECRTFEGETPQQLNPGNGICSTTTFGFGGDNYFINNCVDVSEANLILRYDFSVFPNVKNNPADGLCTSSFSMTSIPLAYESGKCYVQTRLPGLTSATWTCSGGTITYQIFQSNDCTGVATSSNQFIAGTCYSDTTSPPYATGYSFSCGKITPPPTAPPTNPVPTIGGSPAPTTPTAPTGTNPPTTTAPTRKRWSVREVNDYFNIISNKNAFQSGWGADARFSGLTINSTSDSRFSDDSLKFTITFTTEITDGTKINGVCQTVRESFDNNFDMVTTYVAFTCTFSRQSKREIDQVHSVATITLTESLGLSTGAIILIVFGVIIIIILIILIIGLIFYFRSKSGFKEKESDYQNF